MNSEIFREYDIRGIADRDLTDDVVTVLAGAVATYLKEHGVETLTLARDCRLSSERIKTALAAGLTESGLRVIDLGVVPTPLLYFSLHELKPQGGVMVTGSHNPPDYNGLKIALGKTTIHGEQIQQIRKIAESGQFARGKGRLEKCDIVGPYMQFVGENLGRLSQPLKVVIDCGNGTASVVAAAMYRNMGCEVVELFCEMDGRFPNHHPDPTVVENLQDLIQAVRENGADLGIAFDGDADRIGVVDDRGGIVWGDHLMILFSRDILRRKPGACIIGEVKCSMNLYDEIRKHGGRGIMWRAGHSLIKAKMKEENAELGGEMSGHIFLADGYLGFDDAAYAGARLLKLLSKSGKTVSELLSDVAPLHSTPEIRVDTPEALKFEIVRRAQEDFSRRYETVTVDGVRVIFPDGWGLIRASNTQPALVLRFEATSRHRLEEIQEMIEARLGEITDAVAAERPLDD